MKGKTYKNSYFHFNQKKFSFFRIMRNFCSTQEIDCRQTGFAFIHKLKYWEAEEEAEEETEDWKRKLFSLFLLL